MRIGGSGRAGGNGQGDAGDGRTMCVGDHISPTTPHLDRTRTAPMHYTHTPSTHPPLGDAVRLRDTWTLLLDTGTQPPAAPHGAALGSSCFTSLTLCMFTHPSHLSPSPHLPLVQGEAGISRRRAWC